MTQPDVLTNERSSQFNSFRETLLSKGGRDGQQFHQMHPVGTIATEGDNNDYESKRKMNIIDDMVGDDKNQSSMLAETDAEDEATMAQDVRITGLH